MLHWLKTDRNAARTTTNVVAISWRNFNVPTWNFLPPPSVLCSEGRKEVTEAKVKREIRARRWRHFSSTSPRVRTGNLSTRCPSGFVRTTTFDTWTLERSDTISETRAETSATCSKVGRNYAPFVQTWRLITPESRTPTCKPSSLVCSI